MNKKVIFPWAEQILENIRKLVQVSAYIKSKVDFVAHGEEAEVLLQKLNVVQDKWFSAKACKEYFEEIVSIECELLREFTGKTYNAENSAVSHMESFLKEKVDYETRNMVSLFHEFDTEYKTKIKKLHTDISVETHQKVHMKHIQQEAETKLKIERERLLNEAAIKQARVESDLAIKEKELELMRLSKELESCKLKQLQIREKLVANVYEFRA